MQLVEKEPPWLLIRERDRYTVCREKRRVGELGSTMNVERGMSLTGFLMGKIG